MIAKASELGCTTDEYSCLCTKNDFVYGIRDCSYESCNDDSAAATAVAYEVSVCASAGVTIPIATVSLHQTI